MPAKHKVHFEGNPSGCGFSLLLCSKHLLHVLQLQLKNGDYSLWVEKAITSARGRGKYLKSQAQGAATGETQNGFKSQYFLS